MSFLGPSDTKLLSDCLSGLNKSLSLGSSFMFEHWKSVWQNVAQKWYTSTLKGKSRSTQLISPLVHLQWWYRLPSGKWVPTHLLIFEYVLGTNSTISSSALELKHKHILPPSSNYEPTIRQVNHRTWRHNNMNATTENGKWMVFIMYDEACTHNHRLNMNYAQPMLCGMSYDICFIGPITECDLDLWLFRFV